MHQKLRNILKYLSENLGGSEKNFIDSFAAYLDQKGMLSQPQLATLEGIIKQYVHSGLMISKFEESLKDLLSKSEVKNVLRLAKD